MPIAIYALTIGAFGIGVTEFVLMGLLTQVGTALNVSIPTAGLLISGYAVGVAVGAPVLTVLLSGWSRKKVLLALMVIFTIGNLACALAPSYWFLLAARVVTALAHGTFFGVGSVVATSLVKPDRKASAIAVMFTGLTAANILGVPFGTWLGLELGWRASFWAVTAIGIVALAVIARYVPSDHGTAAASDWRADLRAMMNASVIIGLSVTALGFAGLFTVFTYIAPLLTEVTGFSEAAVSPILLVFGGGLVLGNLAGGKLADRFLQPTVIGTLLALAGVLIVFGLVVHSKILTIVMVALLGAAAFSTVAPLQMWVMQKAKGAGESLASSLNIAAFNGGNALGAWLGGTTVAHGLGFTSLPFVAAGIPAIALVVVLIGKWMSGSQTENAAYKN
ncbi:MFS transporter [Rhizobium sp. NBRC 114257]|uniref:MFS transporter n=1 Tax=Rhizobium dioscoreae TaxID=2653122 RepID=A0ABQ0ZD63_9HYPH|nr:MULTISPECIES: MFS transporter [Rhizobium]GES53237.1 MFS transporter [Rhizobium dioscoreae]GLU84677.1 MFS transporter [Rhizobium sp. NBRC 114257]